MSSLLIFDYVSSRVFSPASTRRGLYYNPLWGCCPLVLIFAGRRENINMPAIL
jgi:hypothetical protein